MEYSTTIGVDVSDRTSKICVMRKMPDGERRIVIETTCATTKEGFEEVFARFDRSWPVVFETGTHCRWMDKLFRRMGFDDIIANPGKVPSITKSNTKNDRNDARELARLAIADVSMLHPVKLRDEPYQQMLRYHRGRNALIGVRTKLISQLRGLAKSMGLRIEDCSTERFHKLSKSDWTHDLESVAWPVMDVIEVVNLKIKAFEKSIRDLAETPEFKGMVERVRTVYGVGEIGSTAFVAVIGGDPDRFDRSRDVGAYLGMIPKQDQSGDKDKQLHITHAGSSLLRSALVECAGVVMQANAKDTDLKLKGLRIAMNGGRIAKKKAKVAVARGLAVTMLALLKDPEAEYIPLSDEGKKGFERYHAEMAYLDMKKIAKRDRKAKQAA